MSTSEPNTPITPTTPRTPSFPSIPSLLIRTASQRANTTTHSRNSSIISIPTSPMDTSLPPSTWQRRESTQELLQEDVVMTSPVLDRVPINAFTSIHKESQHPPIHYHITVTSSESVNAGYRNALQNVRNPLIPLISITTGQSHPAFPTSLLQYHLLTHPELDDLSLHYHQTDPPTEQSWRYPCKVQGWLPPQPPASGLGVMQRAQQQRRTAATPTLDTKRRRFGRFIGLRGCDSPQGQDGQREMEERLEREWERQLERRRDEERLREKGWKGVW